MRKAFFSVGGSKMTMISGIVLVVLSVILEAFARIWPSWVEKRAQRAEETLRQKASSSPSWSNIDLDSAIRMMRCTPKPWKEHMRYTGYKEKIQVVIFWSRVLGYSLGLSGLILLSVIALQHD